MDPMTDEEPVPTDQAPRPTLDREYDASVERDASINILKNLGQGSLLARDTAINYGKSLFPEGAAPSVAIPYAAMKVRDDLKTLGSGMFDYAKEEPVRFIADMLPISGQYLAAQDVKMYSQMATDAEAAGDQKAADIYKQIVTLSAAGMIPVNFGAKTGAKTAKASAKKLAGRSVDDLVEYDPTYLPRTEQTEAALLLEKLDGRAIDSDVIDTQPLLLEGPKTDAAAIKEASDSARMLSALTGDALPESPIVVPGAGEAAELLEKVSPLRPEINTEIGDRARVGTTGKYVGAPEGINSPQKLAALTRAITSLTKEGEFGRFWYERSGRQILDLTGGNKKDAEKIIQAIAITSARTPVASNFDFALQAYYQWKNGQPIKTGMFPAAMGKKLQKMFDGEDWAGRKTNNFYNNLMREVDPSKVQGVTTDLWMMRAFGFDKDAPTGAQYGFVENETKRIAQNLGWEPQQVQASIWVALKSRMENKGVKDAVEAKSIKNGWMHFDVGADGSKVRVIDDQNKHAANWLDIALKHSPTDADRSAAKFDYAHAAENNLAQISWESIPSRTSGNMPEIFDSAPEVVQDYHVAMSKSFLDDQGVDIIAKELGILSPGDFEAPGYFEGLVSPGTQTLVAAPKAYGQTRRVADIKAQAKATQRPPEADDLVGPRVANFEKFNLDSSVREATYATEPAAKEMMMAYAAVRGILLKQDGVGLHKPSFGSGITKPKANGIEINIGRPLTARETSAIAKAVAEEAGHTEFNPIGSPNGARFINFDYMGLPNVQFQKLVNKALGKVTFDNNETVDAAMFGADTGYLGNDWKENLNGEGYLETGGLAGRPDLQRKIRDIVTQLTDRVSAVEDEFSNRYNWTRNRNLNSSYEAPQAQGIGSLPVSAPDAPATNPATNIFNLDPKSTNADVPKSRDTLVWMSPDDFLSMAAPTTADYSFTSGRGGDKTGSILDGIKKGELIDVPHLKIFDKDGVAQVEGHEGRHRAVLMKELGYDSMPVVINSHRIRWSEQAGSGRDQIEGKWPTVLKSEVDPWGEVDRKSREITFPVKDPRGSIPDTPAYPKPNLIKPARIRELSAETQTLIDEGIGNTGAGKLRAIIAENDIEYASEVLGEALGNDLNSASDAVTRKTLAEIKEVTQESLKDMPDEVTVYRYGGIDAGGNSGSNIKSFTLNPNYSGPLFSSKDKSSFDAYTVNKKDIEYARNAFFPGADEAEVLIRNDKVRPVTNPAALPKAPSAAEASPALNAFLEGSKSPRVLYSGTSKDMDFDQFRVPRNGAWFTDSKDSASTYAIENDSMGHKWDQDVRNFVPTNTASRVIPVHVAIKNPYKMTEADHKALQYVDNYKRAQSQLFDKLRAKGYDGVEYGGGVWVALGSPKQIKSAIGNKGTFDPKSPKLNKANGGLVERVYNDRKYI